jgi:AcrR family transcriptional regulator
LTQATIEAAVLSSGDRDRILQAMADSCAERGYGETGVADVLERAGVGPEAFAAHFSGKEDCALAALNKIVSECLAEVSTAPARDSEPERRVLQIRALLELTEARASFARLVSVEARQAGTERMHDAYASAIHVLALMAERAADAGSPHPAAAGRAALGGAEAVLRRELARGTAHRIPALLPDFVYAALVPFVGQREALRQAKAAAKLTA